MACRCDERGRRASVWHMAGQTTAKAANKRSRNSGTRSTPRSKPASPTRRPASPSPARRPAPRRVRRRFAGPGLLAAWSLLSRGVGGVARALGRTRELEPAHRRDGLALGLIALAVVVAAAVWWTAGGPVGAGLQQALGALLGAASVGLPVALAGIAVALMRTEPDPAARPRRTVGTLLLSLGVLGLWHLAAGSPADGAGRSS